MKILEPLLGLLVLVLLWWLGILVFAWPEYLVPSPPIVLKTLIEEGPLLWRATLETGWNALLGVACAFATSLAVAFIFMAVSRLQNIFLPWAVFFQTVPVIAIAPLLVIWLGFGPPTVRAAAALVSFFPLLANILAGLLSPSPNQLELFQVYHANRLQIFWKLRLPASVQFMFVGLRVGLGLGVVGAIVGEFIAGGGLGQIIDSARTQQRTELVFAAVLLSCLLGLAFISMVEMLRRSLKRFAIA